MIKDKESRKEYFKAKNKSQLVQFRLNETEQRLLQASMKREGWENISGYIRYQLFGMNPQKKYKKLIQQATEEELGVILANGPDSRSKT